MHRPRKHKYHTTLQKSKAPTKKQTRLQTCFVRTAHPTTIASSIALPNMKGLDVQHARRVCHGHAEASQVNHWRAGCRAYVASRINTTDSSLHALRYLETQPQNCGTNRGGPRAGVILADTGHPPLTAFLTFISRQSYYHSYTHLILALGIVREPTVWGFMNSNYIFDEK